MKTVCPYCQREIGVHVAVVTSTPRRYLVEGTWSGYRSQQQERVCHRVIIPKTHKASIAAYSKITDIRFTDGTYMAMSIRQLLPGEKVVEIHMYDKLLDRIIRRGLTGSISIADIKE